MALAVLSQQYALLIALPLFVLAPTAKRIQLAGAGLLTGAIVVLPLTAMTSGRALRAIAFGTGDNPSEGGTVLWETHANGVAAVLLFRVAPIVVSVVLSWWVARRLGARALEAVPLISLVAVSLGLRLVFEANLFAYYFMALSVTVVLLEVTRGSIRRTAVAWIAALTLVTSHISVLPFGPTRWGGYVQKDVIPLLLGGAALLAILRLVIRDGDRRNLWPWVAVAAVDLFTLLPGGNAFSAGNVIWFWQVVLVVPGLLLAAQPLRTSILAASATEPATSSPSRWLHPQSADDVRRHDGPRRGHRSGAGTKPAAAARDAPFLRRRRGLARAGGRGPSLQRLVLPGCCVHVDDHLDHLSGHPSRRRSRRDCRMRRRRQDPRDRPRRLHGGEGRLPLAPRGVERVHYAGNYQALTAASGGGPFLPGPPGTKYYVIEYDSAGHVWIAPAGGLRRIRQGTGLRRRSGHLRTAAVG